jgi:acyl-CoA synthetase (AMP-forming)/AMP-acid ligase II
MMSKTFWESIAKAGGTHFPGVPFHFATLARLGLPMVPDCVTTFTQAGGALDVKIQTRMHDFAEGRGARFFVMYGQTEAAPRMTSLPHSSFVGKAGSVGLALPGGRIVIEKDSVALGAGQNGDVVYQGPNVMQGYADQRSDLAKGDELGGRLETGDVGYLDGDGFLFLTGRTKRFAKIAGLRLGLDQMEKEFNSVGVVACIDGGEKIIVFFDEGADSLLKERARAIAAEYKIPPTSFSLRRIEAIPRLTGGKVNYAQLKEAANV